MPGQGLIDDISNRRAGLARPASRAAPAPLTDAGHLPGGFGCPAFSHSRRPAAPPPSAGVSIGPGGAAAIPGNHIRCLVSYTLTGHPQTEWVDVPSDAPQPTLREAAAAVLRSLWQCDSHCIVAGVRVRRVGVALG